MLYLESEPCYMPAINYFESLSVKFYFSNCPLSSSINPHSHGLAMVFPMVTRCFKFNSMNMHFYANELEAARSWPARALNVTLSTLHS
jgi:hypothetical protein